MPHTNEAGKSVKVPRGFVPVFARLVRHPGTKEQPFLRPSRLRAQVFVRRNAGRFLARAGNFTKNPNALFRQLNLMMKGAAFAALRFARQRVPVDTGRLKGNINVRQVSQLQFTVGTNVLYAPHVEFGTKPHVIRPRNKKVLHFLAKRRGGKKRGRRRSVRRSRA